MTWSRAREDIRGDLMRARHRLGKLLLRHDVRYDGSGDNWTWRHRQWLSKIRLAERGAQTTLLDYLGAIDALQIRRDTLEATIGELIPSSPWAQDIARLRCLRGIDTLTAVGLCAEINDFERFAHPKQLMSYVGLVPSENSSGQTRRQGAITKSGSQHARRLLVEAAWHYRRPPRRGPPLKNRQQDPPAAVIAIACESSAAAASPLAPPRHPARQTQHDRRRGSRPPPDRLLLVDRDHQHRHAHNRLKPTSAPPHPQRSAEEAAERAWPPRARASAKSL